MKLPLSPWMSLEVQYGKVLEVNFPDDSPEGYHSATEEDMTRLKNGSDELFYLRTTDIGKKLLTKLVMKKHSLSRQEKINLSLLMYGAGVPEELSNQFFQELKEKQCS